MSQIVVPVGMSDLLDDWLWSPDAARWTPGTASDDALEPYLAVLDDYEAWMGYRQRFIMGLAPESESVARAGYLAGLDVVALAGRSRRGRG